MTQDQDHLRILEIFHYVVAGLTALFTLLPAVPLVLGILLARGSFTGGDSAEAEIAGLVMILVSSIFVVTGLVFAATLVYTGRLLTRHRRYYFCLIVAGSQCAFMPFGTILGVFTIMVLVRPSVMSLFGVGVPAAAVLRAPTAS